MLSIFLFMRRANCCVKWRTSRGISSGRSRNGGTRTGKYIQAIEQIGAELLLFDHGGEIAVGGGDQAGVGLERARAAEALKLALLKHAQQLRLELERDFTDLVEKNGAAVGQLEAANALRDGAGERTLLVAKKLTLEQAGGDGGTIQLYERAGVAGAEIMEGPGYEFLSGAGLAINQDGRFRGPQPFRLLSARGARQRSYR